MRFRVRPSRLCMSPFVGSSRKILVVAIISSRAVNHPFGRNQDFVWVGEGGIIKNVAKPITKVIRPSIKNSHLRVHVNTLAGDK